MDPPLYQRPTAEVISIKTILKRTLYKEEGDKITPRPLDRQRESYRINLVATITSKERFGSITSLLLDDGTGTITIRFFEETKTIDGIGVGAVILIVGKVRSYNEEKYVSPEIVRRVDPRWLKVRSLLLSRKPEADSSIKTSTNQIGMKTGSFLEPVESKTDLLIKTAATAEDRPKFPTERVLDLIRKLDTGNGVTFEEIIERSPINGTEGLLEKMLESGEIFEYLPGKVKVL